MSFFDVETMRLNNKGNCQELIDELIKLKSANSTKDVSKLIIEKLSIYIGLEDKSKLFSFFSSINIISSIIIEFPSIDSISFEEKKIDSMAITVYNYCLFKSKFPNKLNEFNVLYLGHIKDLIKGMLTRTENFDNYEILMIAYSLFNDLFEVLLIVKNDENAMSIVEELINDIQEEFSLSGVINKEKIDDNVIKSFVFALYIAILKAKIDIKNELSFEEVIKNNVTIFNLKHHKKFIMKKFPFMYIEIELLSFIIFLENNNIFSKYAELIRYTCLFNKFNQKSLISSHLLNLESSTKFLLVSLITAHGIKFNNYLRMLYFPDLSNNNEIDFENFEFSNIHYLKSLNLHKTLKQTLEKMNSQSINITQEIKVKIIQSLTTNNLFDSLNNDILFDNVMISKNIKKLYEI